VSVICYVVDGKEICEREIDILLRNLKDTILKELAEKYYIEFEFTLPTGQSIKVKAQLKKMG
jgi:hypothetical protein